AVGETRHLGQVRLDDEDAGAAARQLLELAVDLDLRADVDPARRLDTDEQPRPPEQPAGEERLLLVSAAERAHRAPEHARRDAGALGDAADERPLARERDRAQERRDDDAPE